MSYNNVGHIISAIITLQHFACCKDISSVFSLSSGGSLILQMSIISNEIQRNFVYEEAAKNGLMQVEYYFSTNVIPLHY